MSRDAVTLLEEAVVAARTAGMECTGWMMQSGPEGYVAWLYLEHEDHLENLFDEVDVMEDPIGAAQSCLDRIITA